MMKIFVLREESHLSCALAFIHRNWEAFARAGKPLQVAIEQEKVKRSVAQNRAHWSMLNQISEQAWLNGRQYSAEVWHRFFCGEFIGKDEMPDGTFTYISSTTLSVSEFAEFDRRIEVYASQELGVQLVEDVVPLGRTA